MKRQTPSDELARQAWDWLRLLSSRQVSDEDMLGFRRWVKSSAAHQATYNEVKARWDALKPATGALLRADPELVDAYRRAQRGRVRNRRAFLGAATATAAAAGVALVYPPLGLWPSASEWSADYRTATGEQRAIALADRVSVTLNTQTSVRRRTAAGGETTGIDLIAGEAAVDLPDQARSFSVIAGAGRSWSDAGRFEVRYLDARVCVTCIAGTVRVEHPAGTRTLQARQQAAYGARTLGAVADIDPADVSAWRKGVLVFRRTRLVDVVDEINRYRTGRVVLLNDAARDQEVTGHFEIASLDRAVTQLQYMFDLHARSMVGGLLLLT